MRKGPGLRAGPADVGMAALRWNKMLLNRTVVARSCETNELVELVHHEAMKRKAMVGNNLQAWKGVGCRLAGLS